MTALQLENVRKVYHSGPSEIVAVDRASLEVGDAEILALVGAGTTRGGWRSSAERASGSCSRM